MHNIFRINFISQKLTARRNLLATCLQKHPSRKSVCFHITFNRLQQFLWRIQGQFGRNGFQDSQRRKNCSSTHGDLVWATLGEKLTAPCTFRIFWTFMLPDPGTPQWPSGHSSLDLSLERDQLTCMWGKKGQEGEPQRERERKAER